MNFINSDFPNPVLAAGRDDYIEGCKFNIIMDMSEISVSSENINIPVKYLLVCRGLKKLIEEGRAAAVVEARCNDSSYSELFRFKTNEDKMEILIPKYNVVKKVELNGFIIATEKITGFTCDELNSLYFSGVTFEIGKGDILAGEEQKIIYIDDSELEKPLASIFNINKVPEQKEDIVPEFSDHKIAINVNENIFKLYNDFKNVNNGALRRYVTGIIVYPVLVEAITKIKESYVFGSDEVNDGSRWFRAIEKKCEKLGINLESSDEPSVTIANKILGNLSDDALHNLKDVLESEMNDGEISVIGGVDWYVVGIFWRRSLRKSVKRCK